MVVSLKILKFTKQNATMRDTHLHLNVMKLDVLCEGVHFQDYAKISCYDYYGEELRFLNKRLLRKTLLYAPLLNPTVLCVCYCCDDDEFYFCLW